jgi:hypothetical protein
VPLPFQTALPASELDGLPIGAIPAAGDAATRYRWLDRRRAIGVLAVLSLAVAGCLSVSLGPPPKLGNVKGPLDVELYYAVTQRVQAGQAYYDALGGLRARGYSTRSVFNWRTPLHMELIAHLPSLAWARVLLLLAAACAIGISVAATPWDGVMPASPRACWRSFSANWRYPTDATADGGMGARTRMRGGPGMARWIQFGGLRFLLITSRAGLPLGFPFWVAALYLPLAVLGLAGWRGPVGIRVTATLAAYLVAFSVVGAPSMNFYWGAIYAPLLAFRDSCARIVEWRVAGGDRAGDAGLGIMAALNRRRGGYRGEQLPPGPCSRIGVPGTPWRKRWNCGGLSACPTARRLR